MSRTSARIEGVTGLLSRGEREANKMAVREEAKPLIKVAQSSDAGACSCSYNWEPKWYHRHYLSSCFPFFFSFWRSGPIAFALHIRLRVYPPDGLRTHIICTRTPSYRQCGRACCADGFVCRWVPVFIIENALFHNQSLRSGCTGQGGGYAFSSRRSAQFSAVHGTSTPRSRGLSRSVRSTRASAQGRTLGLLLSHVNIRC